LEEVYKIKDDAPDL
jgi:hypothetical protein